MAKFDSQGETWVELIGQRRREFPHGLFCFGTNTIRVIEELCPQRPRERWSELGDRISGQSVPRGVPRSTSTRRERRKDGFLIRDVLIKHERPLVGWCVGCE